MATITIDNQDYEVDPSKNVLAAGLSLGLDIPYFCWHPALGSVGACRQCAVKQYFHENDKTGRIVMACMVPAADKTRISVNDPEAQEFRKGVVEWLMTNHPHDCPVCDEGGECHLQDMTVMTGHTYRRFRFKKRTFENQDLGPFINHEMNRCIQCYRCVRFYKDYAGGSDLDAFGAHNHVYFGRHEDGVLESEFSGNLVEVCPTGVFTDKTLKLHYTRKWDLQSSPSVCAHCGLGCNTLAGTRYGEVRRILNRYNSEVNGYFLCDRGRFGYEFTTHSSRLRQPQTRGAGGEVVLAAPSEAIETLRTRLVRRGATIGIGSPRASLESNFALRATVGPEYFHHGAADGEFLLLRSMVNLLRGAPARPPSLADIERCDAVFILGEDLLNTAPRMALSVRQSLRQQPFKLAEAFHIPLWHDKAVRDIVQGDKGPLFIATPAATGLDADARAAVRAAPQDIARLGNAVARELDPELAAPEGLSADELRLAGTIAAALREAKRPLIISGPSLGSLQVIRAAASVAAALHRSGKAAELSFVTPESNSMGLALLGGLDLADAFQRAERGEVETVIILENDLFRRAHPQQVERFLGQVRNIVVLDCLASRTTEHASLLLPAATFAEGDGTLVNHEGRAQRFFQALDPDPLVRESWRWIDAANPRGPRWRNLDDVLAAIESECPGLEGVVAAAPLSDYRDQGQRIPRSSRRLSGRTAIHANHTLHEPKPPEDTDSALAFSMEGSPCRPPSGLVTHFWAAGWNSVQSLNKFQSEVGGPMIGGEPGRRLIEPSGATEPLESPMGETTAGPGELLVVPLHAIFGSEELSSRAKAVAERIPAAALALNSADAQRHGLAPGAAATLRIAGVDVILPVQIRDDLPAGVIGYPVGRADLPFLELPSTGKLT